MKLIATIAFLALCCLSASAQGKIIIGDSKFGKVVAL